MRKIFGRDKPKMAKVTPASREIVTGAAPAAVLEENPLYSHQQLHTAREAVQQQQRSSNDDHWEVIAPYIDDNTPYIRERDQLPSPRPGVTTVGASRSSSLASLPPGASPPIPSPHIPRPASPFNLSSNNTAPLSPSRAVTQRERDGVLRRRPQTVPGTVVQPTGAAAIGILKALDPFTTHDAPDKESKNGGLHSEDSVSEEKKERKGFWGTTRDKDKDRERDKGRDKREEDSPPELTRMIGYLTANASEDWDLVLEVCDRASASEANAKEAVKALRRLFKYADPPIQLSAARLWAIMLRNSSEIFMQQIMSRKFLETLEEVLTSSRTSPVVRERLMDVLAAVAYACGNKNKDPRGDRDGFRGLWRRLKPADKPDEGVPFDIDDAMFNPPMPRPTSEYSLEPNVHPNPHTQQPHSSPVLEHVEAPPSARRNRSLRSRNRIIPPEEDMRRLFEECNIGQGNASLLSEALAYSGPSDLNGDVVQEFYAKCRASQELIFAQIPWASAGAERSRGAAQGTPQTARVLPQANGSYPSLQSREEEAPAESTVEEELLAAILAANGALLEALRSYEDLERVAIERQAEEISRKDVKMDRRQLQYQESTGQLELPQHGLGGSSSRSPSPSLTSSPPQSFQHPSFVPSPTHPLPRIPGNNTIGSPLNTSATHLSSHSAQLIPPPAAPHGPRSPLPNVTSRTPSPDKFTLVSAPVSVDHHSRTDSSASSRDYHSAHNGLDRLQISELKPEPDEDEDDATTPIKPSAKALGKRKVVDAEPDRATNVDDLFHDPREEPYPPDNRVDSDSDKLSGNPWHQPTKYVYDAAAERTQQRIRRGRVSTLVDGVH